MNTSLTLKTLLLCTLTLGLLSPSYADEPQRWVKVVKDGLYMQLAEVEILDAEGNSLTTNATATASSQWDADSGAEKAIDGNTDGVFANEALYHSGSTDEAPSLTLALNNTTTIDKIKLWNRTDCCTNRMDNTTIYIADHDISDVDTETLDVDDSVAKTRPNVITNNAVEQTIRGTAFTHADQYFNTKRWVKVVKDGLYMQLAEVEILDAEGNSLTDHATATASSQWSAHHDANKAIDGNTDGVFNNRALYHSGSTDDTPSLTIALNNTTAIDSIKLWSRTDCCIDRMNNITLYVADYDISEVDTATLNADDSVAKTHPGAIKNSVTEQALYGTAFTQSESYFSTSAKRWVKIVKEGLYMQLAEVKILDAEGDSLTDGATATASSQWSAHHDAKKAIDGNTDGVFNNRALYHSGHTDETPSLTIALIDDTPIDMISLWNRTDCCQDRMNNITVYVADYDISDVDKATLDADGTVAKSTVILNSVLSQNLLGTQFIDNTLGLMDLSRRFHPTYKPFMMLAQQDQTEPVISEPLSLLIIYTQHYYAPDSIKVIEPPTNGTLTVNNDNTLSYIPNPGFSGTEAFKIHMQDGLHNKDVEFWQKVYVKPSVLDPDAPKAVFNAYLHDYYVGQEDGEPIVTVPVLGEYFNLYDFFGGIDNGFGTVNIQVIKQPKNGTATVTAKGVLTYTPKP